MNGGVESSIAFSTGVGVDPVVNNDYVLDLVNGTDTVSVGGIAVKDLDLFLIIDQTPQFNIDPFSGIQGNMTVSNSIIPRLTSIQGWGLSHQACLVA